MVVVVLDKQWIIVLMTRTNSNCSYPNNNRNKNRNCDNRGQKIASVLSVEIYLEGPQTAYQIIITNLTLDNNANNEYSCISDVDLY